MDWRMDDTSSSYRVSPFRHLRIKDYLHLPAAFRSLSRLSSALSAGGILCKRSGFGDYENQYFWQSKVFDGKLFLGTFDTSSLLEPLGQFTNGDLLKMSREEWASQIGYLRVLLKLLLNQDKNGDGTLIDRKSVV